MRNKIILSRFARLFACRSIGFIGIGSRLVLPFELATYSLPYIGCIHLGSNSVISMLFELRLCSWLLITSREKVVSCLYLFTCILYVN
jgi:hypothetical protein